MNKEFLKDTPESFEIVGPKNVLGGCFIGAKWKTNGVQYCEAISFSEPLDHEVLVKKLLCNAIKTNRRLGGYYAPLWRRYINTARELNSYKKVLETLQSKWWYRLFTRLNW